MSLWPLSRLEKFLAKIAGNYDEIQPISRLEHFLDDIAVRLGFVEPLVVTFSGEPDSDDATVDITDEQLVDIINGNKKANFRYSRVIPALPGSTIIVVNTSLPNIKIRPEGASMGGAGQIVASSGFEYVKSGNSIQQTVCKIEFRYSTIQSVSITEVVLEATEVK